MNRLICRIFPIFCYDEPEPHPPPEPVPPSGQQAADCAAAHTAAREERGLAPLEYSDCLALQAQLHAEWMARHGRLTHDGFGKRLRACDIGAGGENVAQGYRTGQSVVDGWLLSPGHRENVLKPSWTQIGIGYYSQGGDWWCALYAR